MKEGFDKEIDSLLRRHGRAGAHARGDGARAARAAAHLDADELSAFAEGALPAAARLAAVSHLADCDECRGHAVGLARAAGVEGELEKLAASAQVEPARPARRRGWLSALFAPRVLRYAAPALALCLVAAVSFVALRSRRGKEELARRASSGEARRAGAARVEDGAGDVGQLTSNANMSANANAGVAPPEAAGVETQGETEAKTSAGAPRATQAARGPNAEGETATVTAEEPKRAEAPPPPTAEEKAPAAAEPAAPAKSGPTEAAKAENKEAKAESKEKDERKSAPQEVASNDQPTQQEKQRSNQQRNLDQVSPDGSRNQRSVANNTSNNSSGGSAGLAAATPREDRDRTEQLNSAPASRRGRSSGESRAREGDDEDARSEETRSAAGHRFRREGGAWVDVKYKPSMPSTGVRRGTDSYRALVADIPEVGRVAEQLGGEVVVVIRGRAYRIR